MPDVIGAGTYTDPTANTLDLVTLAEAKVSFNLATSNTTWDGELATLITAVSQRFDELCGPIVNRTVTAEKHDGGGWFIVLDYAPVYSLTTVTEYANTTATTLTAETNSSKTASNYLCDLPTGILHRRGGNIDRQFPWGRQNVEVTYTAGRYTTTGNVARRFKEAAQITLANIWRREQGGGTATFGGTSDSGFVVPGFAIPNAALELIKGDLRAPIVR